MRHLVCLITLTGLNLANLILTGEEREGGNVHQTTVSAEQLEGGGGLSGVPVMHGWNSQSGWKLNCLSPFVLSTHVRLAMNT